jgi:hypothetical protein
MAPHLAALSIPFGTHPIPHPHLFIRSTKGLLLKRGKDEHLICQLAKLRGRASFNKRHRSSKG